MGELVKVIYASGETGKSIRADGNGKSLARGYYVKKSGSSYRGYSGGLYGPFKTKNRSKYSRVWAIKRT